MKKEKELKPTSVRLGQLKEPLQMEAMRIDRSLNWLILSILKEQKFVKDFNSKQIKSCKK